MTETQFILAELEKRIQKLIHLHKELKESSAELMVENDRLRDELRSEHGKLQEIKEGYHLIQESEKIKASRNVGQLKKKINDIISEIDKNVQLISEHK